MSRCVNTEGSVLYMINELTGEVELCKTKSVRYIIMRMLRQAIINRGYMGVKNFINRVIDSEDYHGLNTRAAIRISVQLMDFVHWMLINKIPRNVLGVLPVESVRGKLQTGFAIWWNHYLSDTGVSDINVSLKDFVTPDVSTFSKIIYNSGVKRKHICFILVIIVKLQTHVM